MHKVTPDPDSLRAGDIVFIRIANFLYRRVAEATRSWTSHVGFLHHREGEAWMVAESAIPRVRLTPLPSFLARSDRGQYAITRLHSEINEEAAEKLRRAASSRMGTLYHLGFKYDSPRQFCSKFVYDCYRDALDVRIGRLETFRELLASNPDSPLWFWRLWFWGRIPWERRTITPASQLEDPQLTTVTSHASS
ncbi:MAG: YebB family permuted papain-like enzyme [Verrucomicrobiota bacterium]